MQYFPVCAVLTACILIRRMLVHLDLVMYGQYGYTEENGSSGDRLSVPVIHAACAAFLFPVYVRGFVSQVRSGFAMVMRVPGSVECVSHTLPPITEPFPITTAPRMVAPA